MIIEELKELNSIEDISANDLILIEGIESDFKNKTFVEVDEFRKEWKELGLTDENLQDLQNLISSGKGSITPLGSNIFKIRFSPKQLNRGKNTAMRTIYAYKPNHNYTFLITVFSKSDESNITKTKLDEIRKQSDWLFNSMR